MQRTFYPDIPCKRVADAPMPAYAHDGDAGLDLCATEDVTLLPGESCKMGSGIALAIPYGMAGIVIPRSGLGTKGLVVKNNVGLIDSTYRGEIGLTLYNNNPTHIWEEDWDRAIGEVTSRKLTWNDEDVINIRKGDRVAQLVIISVPIANLIEVNELDETERGVGSFGLTGLRYERP